MKFFIDTANLEEIRQAAGLGILDGVTTNPTLLGKEIERTGKDYKEILLQICQMVDGPVSGEVLSLEADKMVAEAEDLAKIHQNIVIKVPMIKEGILTVKRLSDKGIRTNVTLVFSSSQALLAAKAGATFVSPFIGRLDDVGHVGMDLVEEILAVFENYGFETQVIVASIRHPLHVADAALIGADIATIPFAVIEKLVHHPLTDIGIEKFQADWEKAREPSSSS
ncbi:fructose-6-phosphate aldolase [bacterium]|nr:fructose-6-phosphate aldolase [bacterium]